MGQLYIADTADTFGKLAGTTQAIGFVWKKVQLCPAQRMTKGAWRVSGGKVTLNTHHAATPHLRSPKHQAQFQN
jgi:hypothetical protein